MIGIFQDLTDVDYSQIQQFFPISEMFNMTSPSISTAYSLPELSIYTRNEETI